MGQRRTARVTERKPVRIYGLDSKGKAFSHPVETLDISSSGARLAGVHQFEAPGETIGVEVEGQKARFLVVWVGRKGTKNDGQVGIRSLEPKKPVWKLTMPEESPDTFRKPHIYNPTHSPEVMSYLEWRDERRLWKRMPLKAGAMVVPLGRKEMGWGMCSDVSKKGCYIETMTPLPLDSQLEVVLRINGRELRAKGVVRSARPSWGMGIEFLDVEPEDQAYLEATVSGKIRLGQSE